MKAAATKRAATKTATTKTVTTKTAKLSGKVGAIRIGIGGWTFEPWRGVFYPDKLPQRQELEYAASKLTSIEINGTYYSSFKPASWAKWRDETPDGFVFSVKASRYCTNRRVLADAKESIEAKFEGTDMSVAFNPQFLLDGLAAIGGDEALLETVDPLKPATLRSNSGEAGEFLYLLMPVRIS